MRNSPLQRAPFDTRLNEIRDEKAVPKGARSPGGSPTPLSELNGPSRSETLHQQFPGRAILERDQKHELVRLTKGTTLNPESAEFAQLTKLHQHLDSAITRLGSTALLRDMLHPPNTLAEVDALRSAIRELQENLALRTSLVAALKSTQKKFLRGKSVEETALLTLAPDLADTSKKNLGLLGTIGEKIRTYLNAHNDMPRRISSLGKLLRSIEWCPRPRVAAVAARI